jgi:hypothetical protein
VAEDLLSSCFVVVGLDLRATNRSSCERVRGGAVSSVPCPL